MSDTNPPAEAASGSAVRLIFEFDGDDVRLVSQQRVDVAVTGFDLPVAPPPGHYVELRDATGDPLSRVPARAAFAASAEVFPEDHAEPITRIDVERPQGAFTVVVPAPEAAQQIAVVEVAQPPAPPAGAEELAASGGVPLETTSRDLATFPLELDG
jgi:hypothetical protein